MWWNKTKQLTPKQEALIATIQEKWRAIAFPTEPVDRQKASVAVKTAYELMGFQEPEILFFDSPYQALVTVVAQLVEQLDSQWINRLENQLSHHQGDELESELVRQLISQLISPLEKQLGCQLGSQFDSQLNKQLESQLTSRLDSKLVSGLDTQLKNLLKNQRLSQLVHQQENQLNSQLVRQLVNQLKSRMKSRQANKLLSRLTTLLESQRSSQLVSRLGNLLGKRLFYNNCIHSELWASQGSWLDFCRSVLNGNCDLRKWQVFHSLVSNCGWIFPYEKTCIVCDRPIKLCFDSNRFLHAEGEFALLFADGYSLYFNHGVVLPRKYGQLHPSQWQAEWILHEDNAELRRTLIQGIGYDRICQELEARELDSWQEYTLLRIEKIIDDMDKQPIHLLKMACPSTGYIHALRVPPEMRSAREAIRWVNWGVDPERFALQS